jgi:hypothetical protein
MRSSLPIRHGQSPGLPIAAASGFPDTVERFNEFHDFGTLGGPLNGIYLTPVSGTENKMGNVIKDERREWARFILHNVNLKNFPLRWVAPGYRR